MNVVKSLIRKLMQIKELGVSMDDDPQYDFLTILMKIESNVNYLTEAREHLNKVQRYKLKDKNGKTAIEHSENVHKAEERKEK